MLKCGFYFVRQSTRIFANKNPNSRGLAQISGWFLGLLNISTFKCGATRSSLRAVFLNAQHVQRF